MHGLIRIIEETSIMFQSNLDAGRLIHPKNTMLIAHLHVLPSTVPLFKALCDIGFDPRNSIIVPKPYSTIQESQAALVELGYRLIEQSNPDFEPGTYDAFIQPFLAEACETALAIGQRTKPELHILLDDGGQLTRSWSKTAAHDRTFTVSVQLTSSGMREETVKQFPGVAMASSPLKKTCEPSVICQAILEKLGNLDLLENFESCSVIGFGSIGAELCRRLLLNDKTVFGFDEDGTAPPSEVITLNSHVECFSQGEMVFGCSGDDVTTDIDLGAGLYHNKVFVSTSSRDMEFRSLLAGAKRIGANGHVFDDLLLDPENAKSPRVVNGGFPVNFDREREWEKPEDIGLTRGLLLLSVIQAAEMGMSQNIKPLAPLDWQPQRRLLEIWLEQTGRTLSEFLTLERDLQAPG